MTGNEMNDWLTTEQVEHIQWAVLRNRPVGSFVNGFRYATLPALLEYGCLRAHVGADAIPPLPAAIVDSPLGLALDCVPSPLGTRNGSRYSARPARLDTQSVEFFSISTEVEMERDSPDSPPKPWELYAIRFSRSAQAAGFTSTVANGLMAALYEMTRNALEHAESPHPALVGYQAEGGMALFCVVDAGRGVLASLRSCTDYSQLTTHADAISTAIQEGTSRKGYRKGGLGFRQVFRALAEFNGHLRFRSGDACLQILGSECGPNRGDFHGSPSLHGFQITVCCRTRALAPDDPPAV
jgi:anti-sigma regulatory factor (Ser/Thr protein kinase)